MAQLPPRSTADTRASHVSDHNELHETYNTMDPDAASDGDILKMSAGAWLADTAANHGISEDGHPHTASDISDQQNLSITESQISDLSHFTEQPVTYVTTNYAALVTDRVIVAKTDSQDVTITLPDTATFGAYAVMVKNKGTNQVTIQRTVPDLFWTDGSTGTSKTLNDNGAQWIGAADPTADQWLTLGERGSVS